jgi:16S rRNA (guanine527-N7)-methyltransferase
VRRSVGDSVTPAESAAIESVLTRSRSLGFLGPGSVRVQLEHARGFAAGPVGLGGDFPRRVLDLGSGGGVPGLVLAYAWPDAQLVLLDAAARRTAFLESAVAELGFGARVQVVRRRGEEAGRDLSLRGRFDVVVARGFGPPAVTAECAAPFLHVGGRLLVSDPPADGSGDLEEEPTSGDCPGGPPDRWPATGLDLVGLAAEASWAAPFRYRSLVLTRPCPERLPRRVGVPAKRPLF